MLRRLMNKKVIIGLLGTLVLFAASSRMMTTFAEEYRFVNWSEGVNENEVKVGITLSARDIVQKAGTFQVQLGVSPEMAGGVEDIKFTFDQDIEKNNKITVKTYRYNRDNDTLTLYISGTGEDVLKKGTPLSLGTITVSANSDVTFSVVEEGCKVADEHFTEQPVTVFGSQDEYTVRKPSEPDKPDESKPDESKPDESKPEESKPENPPGGGDSTVKPESPQETDSPWADPQETKGSWSSKDGSWSFQKEDGSLAQNEWIKIAGEWYWIGQDSRMVTGWINLNNVWYFCSPSGAMKTGWVQDGNLWYYCSPSGSMRTGWVQDKNIWYYLEESGAMKTGWTQVNEKWYYMDGSGKLLTDTVTPDGVRVDKNGVRAD